MRITNNERVTAFERNQKLEELLIDVNHNLWKVEQDLLKTREFDFPLVFIVGAHRSGSTLLMQWLADLNIFSYPTNLLSRFFQAPIMGAKLQLLLTDEQYNYRDELKDFRAHGGFSSENGKTKGALAPNEFWYFWRRFLPFDDLDYLPTEQLLRMSETQVLVDELSGMMNIFHKPMALKAMIMNYNLNFLNQLFEKAIFIYIKRDPLTNIESGLDARKNQFGCIDEWYSFKIPEYHELKKLNPYEQVAGQIYYINKAVEKGLAQIAEHKKITVQYESFCNNPKQFYGELCDKLKLHDFEINLRYNSIEKFEVTRKEVKDVNILKAFKKFY